MCSFPYRLQLLSHFHSKSPCLKIYLSLTIFLAFKKVIGSPNDTSLRFLQSDNARRYVRQLPQYPRQQFTATFPSMSPGAVDLLEKMLVFDPNRRIIGKIT